MNDFEHNHHLTPEDRMADIATGDGRRAEDSDAQQAFDEAAASLQSALTPRGKMPDRLRQRLVLEGEALVTARRGGGTGGDRPRRFTRMAWLAAAACLGIAVVTAAIAVKVINDRNLELTRQQQILTQLNQRIEDNQAMLASVRAESDQLLARLDQSGDEHARAIAQARQRNLELAEQLARVTSDYESRLSESSASLADARARITQLTTPVSPDQLAANRRKLLDVPDTVRIEWVPFDLSESNLAEQRGDVAGDVVWNDQKQEGYLRFTGLAVNDPGVEQYQVWLIDERGMEQKVSGGVFNANADGEIIVPIEPGIDVGRVAVFAITVEEPGGIWVPDLKRRVVVAPRGEDSES
ncbi:MAG: anti-sigma factor [Phycisphaerales bacterium]|nr:anti-sigma factor [Phycisphaerales bacterium]